MTGNSLTNSVVRRLQLLLAEAPWSAGGELLTVESLAQASAAMDWLREVIAQPHPALGRPGPICPFVQAAINGRSLWLGIDDADGASVLRLRWSVLRHLVRFRRKVAAEHRPALASSLMIFPRFERRFTHRLDELHSEIKTDAMDSGVMVSAFHPDSTRPALHNPDFHVLRAPVVAFAFRTMDVRDIVFLASNRRAFDRYRAQFLAQHASGQVSDEHGYATAFAEAEKRFGYR